MGTTKYSVIVAEDERLLLDHLAEKIEACAPDFEVAGKAQTGDEAYRLVKEHNPDLLITDIRMPVMNGIELLKNVYNHCPLTKFIIISGYSDFEYAQSAIRLHVSEYLLKPVDPEELTLALGNIRKQYQIEQKAYEDIFNESMTRNSPEQIAATLRDYQPEPDRGQHALQPQLFNEDLPAAVPDVPAEIHHPDAFVPGEALPVPQSGAVREAGQRDDRVSGSGVFQQAVQEEYGGEPAGLAEPLAHWQIFSLT